MSDGSGPDLLYTAYVWDAGRPPRPRGLDQRRLVTQPVLAAGSGPKADPGSASADRHTRDRPGIRAPPALPTLRLTGGQSRQLYGPPGSNGGLTGRFRLRG